MKKINKKEPAMPIHVEDSIYNELNSMESLLSNKDSYRYFKFNKFRTEIISEINRCIALFDNELKIIVVMFKSKNLSRKDVLQGWNCAWNRFQSRMISLNQKLQTFKNAYFKNDLIN